MAIISLTELAAAHHNWCQHFKLRENTNYFSMVDSFTTFAQLWDNGAVTWADGRICREVVVHDHAAQCVKMLVSPHWETLLKAHVIRQEA